MLEVLPRAPKHLLPDYGTQSVRLGQLISTVNQSELLIVRRSAFEEAQELRIGVFPSELQQSESPAIYWHRRSWSFDTGHSLV